MASKAKIWKTTLNPHQQFIDLYLPLYKDVHMTVGIDGYNQVCLWYAVDDSAIPTTIRIHRVFTGVDYDPDMLYLGTVVVPGTELVCHYFMEVR